MKRYKTVDDYIDGAEHWQDELVHLREILAATRLDETVKWGAPCYTYEGKKVVGIGAFKSYVGLWFFQGALLSDPDKVLINAQKGKTKALRQWRFASKKDIKAQLIKAYVKEAVEAQLRGTAIKPTRGHAEVVPPELRNALSQNRRAGAAFEKLTKGRQREFADYIADAKREETKAKRLKKILPMIVAGEGLSDKYRK